MSKRNTGWDEGKIQRYISEGRGKGEGSGYKPWLTIQDVPSDGRVSRCHGWKTERIHHLMSDHEKRYFFLLEWAVNVVDILEQFPLEREVTCKIAEDKKIRHPQDTKTKTPLVMTTDFLIKISKNGEVRYIARTVKPSDFLEQPRVIEKFEIERQYWENKKVDWAIVTEKEIPLGLTSNIEWMHPAYWPDQWDDYNSSDYQKLCNILVMQLKQSEHISMMDLLNKLNEQHHLRPGSFLYILRYCMARKIITCDLTQKIDLRTSVCEFRTHIHSDEQEGREADAGNKRYY